MSKSFPLSITQKLILVNRSTVFMISGLTVFVMPAATAACKQEGEGIESF